MQGFGSGLILGKRTITTRGVSLKLSSQLHEFFMSGDIDNAAKSNKFVRRKSALTGDAFVDTLMHCGFGDKTKSLNDMVSYLHLNHQVTISKQALDQRFSIASTLFLKNLVEKFLKEILPKESSMEQFKNFRTVKIKDSTCFQLPEAFASIYPGSGGAASKAMIRIQFEYDFKSGTVYDLSAHAFNDQDQTDSQETLSGIQGGDLLIRDLGYVNIKYMEHIEDVCAYYLNRSSSNVVMYEKKNNGKFVRLDLDKIKHVMKANGLDSIEKEVYLSSKKSVKTRLIIELLPQDEYEKRIRKATKEANKKKRQLSNEFKIRAALNLFITNIPKKLLATDKVRNLYRLRWQVELIFKTWKSFGALHETKQMKIDRFNTNLFAKLLLILLNWKILWTAYSCYWQKNIFVSLIKFFKLLINQQSEIRESIRTGIGSLIDRLDRLFTMPKATIQSEKKKGNMSLKEILLMN